MVIIALSLSLAFQYAAEWERKPRRYSSLKRKGALGAICALPGQKSSATLPGSYLASAPTAPQWDFQPPRERTVPWAILTIYERNSLCEAEVGFLETLSLSSNSICMDSDLANFILVPAL